MKSQFLQFAARQEKKRIKTALRTGKVFAMPTKVLKHDPEASYQIYDVRISNGQIQGKSHIEDDEENGVSIMGYWFSIKSWEKR
jgi:hypothetical protein